MKTKRFDFAYSPLLLSHGLTVTGSVPSKQSYNADEDEYEPDYTLTPLVVQPFVRIMDKDGVLVTGSVNEKLTNMSWTEYEGNSKKTIETSNTNYVMSTAGSDKGKLVVKRNVSDGAPVTLVFYAEYYDDRTKQVSVIQDSILISCKNASPEVPVLTLTADGTSIYNPLRDNATQTVKATLYLGKKECPAANRLFVWEIMRDGAWYTLGSSNLDYFATVSSDTSTLTMRRDLMGEGVSIRCRARYSRDGVPSTVTLTNEAPTAAANFVRRIPNLDYEISGVPYNLAGGTGAIHPQVIIRDAKGILSDPSAELLPLWLIATNKASGSLSYETVAHGYKPTISTKYLDNEYGAVLAVDLVDNAWKGLTDADGAGWTDKDGNLLLLK
jgi:hypothetical protein